jgi:hypothetical protein
MTEKPASNHSIRLWFGIVVWALLFQIPVSGQTAAKWELLAPKDEEFTIMLPGKPEFDTQKKPFGQLTLTTNTYLLVSDDGPMFLVTSVGGMQDISALVTEKEGVTAYANGFWEGFFQPAKEKGLTTGATRLRDLTLHGHPGAAYDIVFGSMSGTSHVYKTPRKFYVTLILNAPKGDPRIDQFLNSFTLPDKEPKSH